MLGQFSKTLNTQLTLQLWKLAVEWGILSLFLVRDGKTKKVYAVEANSASKITKNVVRHNGYGHRRRLRGGLGA